MPYTVTATLSTPGTGVGSFQASTAKDALEKARNLRSQGMTVGITDADGNPVNEEDLEDDA